MFTVSVGFNGSGYSRITIRIQGFDDQKFKKLTAENFYISKTTIYLSLYLHKGRPSYRRSIQPLKKNMQHFETWNFLIFSILGIAFALLDPNPDTDPLP
jgi:hypothetical protein